jgi:hypothetical protein
VLAGSCFLPLLALSPSGGSVIHVPLLLGRLAEVRIIAEASVWPTDLRSGPRWAARHTIKVNARCTPRPVSS